MKAFRLTQFQWIILLCALGLGIYSLTRQRALKPAPDEFRFVNLDQFDDSQSTMLDGLVIDWEATSDEGNKSSGRRKLIPSEINKGMNEVAVTGADSRNIAVRISTIPLRVKDNAKRDGFSMSFSNIVQAGVMSADQLALMSHADAPLVGNLIAINEMGKGKRSPSSTRITRYDFPAILAADENRRRGHPSRHFI